MLSDIGYPPDGRIDHGVVWSPAVIDIDIRKNTKGCIFLLSQNNAPATPAIPNQAPIPLTTNRSNSDNSSLLNAKTANIVPKRRKGIEMRCHVTLRMRI